MDDADVMVLMEAFEDSSSSSESSSSENSDEEMYLDLLERVAQSAHRNTIKDYCEKVVPTYSDREFVMHFRVRRSLMMDLADQFEQSDIYQALNSSGWSRLSVSPEKHMLTFLWFAGHQTASFRDVADRFDVSLSTLHDITVRVIEFLSFLADKYIQWPTQAERDVTKAHYFQTKGFPNIVGSIDGCHIKIDKPGKQGDDYINRHGFPSMLLQGICDHNTKFIDIFTGYPGSVHDARVFDSSPISRGLRTSCGDGYLLGDTAYPLLDHLMTPYRDNGHLTGPQKFFNRKLSSCRISIEHSFGLLKQRFRQLYHLKIKGHMRICHFIRACCVLHNLADKEDLLAFEGEDNPEDDQPAREDLQEENGEGSEMRNEVTRQLYLQRENE